MRDEELLDWCIKNPDFLCESGSHLYGMATPTSDIDLRGFTFPPFSYIIGVKNFDCAEFDEDTKVHNVFNFIKLSLAGDPQSTELFFANKKNIKMCSNLGQEVINLKKDIVSNKIYGRIMGYSVGEWRKAMAIKVVPKKWKKEKHEVINDIKNLWSPDKKSMDTIISTLENLDEVEIVSSFTGIGSKRKEDIEKYGFCRKSAAHAIRLVNQLSELMENGQIVFPIKNHELLLDIRNGIYKKEEVEEVYLESMSKAEKIREVSVLPDKPNEKKVWETMEQLVAKHIKEDIKFKKLCS